MGRGASQYVSRSGAFRIAGRRPIALRAFRRLVELRVSRRLLAEQPADFDRLGCLDAVSEQLEEGISVRADKPGEG
jgi:hypothetical protein